MGPGAHEHPREQEGPHEHKTFMRSLLRARSEARKRHWPTLTWDVQGEGSEAIRCTVYFYEFFIFLRTFVMRTKDLTPKQDS